MQMPGGRRCAALLCAVAWASASGTSSFASLSNRHQHHRFRSAPLLAERAAALRLERDREAAALLVRDDVSAPDTLILNGKPQESLIRLDNNSKPMQKNNNDYNAETQIHVPFIHKWTDRTRLPFSVEFLVACTWVIMVGAMPLIIIAAEKQTVTRTQYTICIAMWIVYFGGLYLFTNVIVFESYHFENARTLTLVECVYLMSQMLTTVGYGDIVPALPRGQLFIGLYVFFSMLVIGNIISEVLTLMMIRTSDYTNELKDRAMKFEEEVLADKLEQLRKSVSVARGKYKSNEESKMLQHDPSVLSARSDESVANQADSVAYLPLPEDAPLEVPEPPPIDYHQLLAAVSGFCSFVAVGWAFFVYYPGEGKTFFQAGYMSIITLSTVGFGAVTPSTEAGKVFSAFWMLFGTASLVNVVSQFTELTVNLKARERWIAEHMDSKAAHCEALDAILQATPARIDRASVYRVALSCWQLVAKEELDMIDDMFEEWVEVEEVKDDMVDKYKLLSMRHQQHCKVHFNHRKRRGTVHRASSRKSTIKTEELAAP